MTRYSEFVKRFMAQSGKNWSCSVCEIQKGGLYNKYKKDITRENKQMGMEDRDAPAPVPKTFKIKVNRKYRMERSMMGMEDMDAPSHVKTIEPSPIPPPEALVPADLNMRTSVPLGESKKESNNKYRLQIMLALTYLVPKRINVNTSENKKTHGIFGRDEDTGKLITMSVAQKDIKERLHNLLREPFNGRNANKLANEIVKPGEKSYRLQVMINYMKEHLSVELPDEVTPDWKFKYTGGASGSTPYSFRREADHSNLFKDIDSALWIYEYAERRVAGFSDEEED